MEAFLSFAGQLQDEIFKLFLRRVEIIVVRLELINEFFVASVVLSEVSVC